MTRWIEVGVGAASPLDLAVADALVASYALRGSAVEGDPPVLRAWFSSQERAAAEALQAALTRTLPQARVAVREVPDAAWADAWREHFRPQVVGEVAIVPSWERRRFAQQLRAIVELDPGQAFGTGLHPTTRACLVHVQELDLRGRSVCDVGTGSGILAIAAAKLGAAHVFACDVDPVAVRAASENVVRNGVASTVRVAACRADLAAVAAADVVVANLTADLIVSLAPALCARLRPGGTLVLAGIAASRQEEVRAALAAVGARAVVARADGEWLSLRVQGP